MSCDRETILLISSYTDGETTAGETERAQDHLAQCADCRNLVEQWQGHQQLFAWAYTRELPDVLNMDALIVKAEKEKRPLMERKLTVKANSKPAPTRRWAWIGTAAAVLLIAFLSYHLFQAQSFLLVGREFVTDNSTRSARVGMHVDLTVGPNSKIRRISKQVIRLEQGWVAASVQHGDGITIETTRMRVTDRGTSFHVGIGAKAEYVTVEDGAVDVTAGEAQHRINTGQALLISTTGDLTLLSVPVQTSGVMEDGRPLRGYHTVFQPSTAEELHWEEGKQRLAKRFPDLRLAGGFSRSMDSGNRTDCVVGDQSVSNSYFRQQLRAHLPQIAQTLAGGQRDTGTWELPIGIMQLIGFTSPAGLIDDVYYLRLTAKDGAFSWRFTGSQGHEVSIPVTFKKLRDGIPYVDGRAWQAVGSTGGIYSKDDVRRMITYLLVDWPGDAKPKLEFRVQGPQELDIWQDQRAMLADLSNRAKSIPGLELKDSSSQLLYLDPQRKHHVLIAWNTDFDQQLYRMPELEKSGRGGSAILAVIKTDTPLIEPEVAAGVYLLRFVLPRASHTPQLELTTLDMRSVKAWRASSRTLQIHRWDDKGGKSFGHNSQMTPAYGAIALQCSTTEASGNAFPFRFQVVGRPDDMAMRAIKKGNSTTQRMPIKVWAEGWIRIKKP